MWSVVNVVGGRGEREEEGRSGQQSTSDDADTPSLVLLLSAAVLCVRDKPLGSPLLSCEGVVMDGEEDGAASELEEGRSG